MRRFQYIFMVNGMTFVEDRIYLLQAKLGKILNLQKLQAHIGEEIQKMKCYKEYMEHLGPQKKI